MKAIQKISMPFLLLVSVVSFIYLYLALRINIDISHPTNLSYFNYLIQAFQNHRLDIISSSVLDLSFYHEKWFMYWGPAPILFILPFYIVSGILASDILYTLFGGIFNVLIFYLIVKEFTRYFKLSISPIKQYLVVLSFAFVSPNLYLSLAGRIWHTSQIISIFYLLVFYFFYFKFLNNLNKLKFLILAVIFVNLAWFSRYTLIFNLLLLLYPLSILYKRNFSHWRIAFLVTVLITALIFSLMLIYNYVRFANPLETGIRYVVGSIRYDKILKEGKILSLSYLEHNLTSYFLSPPQLSFNPLKLHINHEGNSVFAIYPYLFFVLPLFRRKFYGNIKQRLFLLLLTLVLFLNISTLLIYFATGWVQFGSRYFFDVIPLLFLFALFVIQKTRLSALIIIFFYGIIVNLLGTFAFYR